MVSLSAFLESVIKPRTRKSAEKIMLMAKRMKFALPGTNVNLEFNLSVKKYSLFNEDKVIRSRNNE